MPVGNSLIYPLQSSAVSIGIHKYTSNSGN